MEPKKISFGFTKTKKAEKPVLEEKKDFIECIEEQAIKIVGGENVKENIPLVIPMKPNTLITAERLKAIGEKVESAIDEQDQVVKQEIEPDIKPENETLDEMAIRELVQDAKKQKNIKVESALLTVPVPSIPVLEGQKESTLEDYEAVPVQDFGMAMLRGMGWTAAKEQSKYKQPQLRPKGLGLGADKVISKNPKQKVNKDKEEELSIVKNSFVKITTGKYGGYYGKVVSLDDDNGRVMVDIAVKKETVSLSEFMMRPVTKSEYDKESKVLNADTYEQYKKNESSSNANNCNRSHKDEKKINNMRKEETSPNGRIRKETRRRRSSSRENVCNNRKENNGHKSSSKEAISYNKRNDRDTRENSNNGEESYRHRSRRERSESFSSSKEDLHTQMKNHSRDSSSSENRSRNKRNEREKQENSSNNRRSRISKNKREHSKSPNGDGGSRARTKKKNKKRYSSSSEDRSRNRRSEKVKHKHYKERDSSNDSMSVVSDTNRKSKKKDKKKYSSDSESSEDLRVKKSSQSKRDIDKKRKGKKKKRDRDRSPNYRKHKKCI